MWCSRNDTGRSRTLRSGSRRPNTAGSRRYRPVPVVPFHFGRKALIAHISVRLLYVQNELEPLAVCSVSTAC